MDIYKKKILEETGKNLRKARLRKGLTQVELAKMVGYSDSTTIHKIEKGLQDVPISKVRGFCKALDVDFDYLKGNIDYIYNDKGEKIALERHQTDVLTRSKLVTELTGLIRTATDEQLASIIGIIKIFLGGDENGYTDME